MSGPKQYDFNPYNLRPDILQAIGLLIACSGQTEDIFESAVAGCLGLDIEYGLAVTTHMSMPLRVSVLKSAAEIRIDDLDALDELDDIIEVIEEAFSKRNAVAHNQLCRDPETEEVFSVKEVARISVQADLHSLSVDQIRNDALFVYEAGITLFRFLKTHGLNPNFPAEPRPRGHKSRAARKARRKQGM